MHTQISAEICVWFLKGILFSEWTYFRPITFTTAASMPSRPIP